MIVSGTVYTVFVISFAVFTAVFVLAQFTRRRPR